MLPESIEKEKKLGRLQRENFRHALNRARSMAFGTDAGVYPHGDNAKQFAKMVECGMKPLDAIQAATINAAALIGMPGKIGVLAAGRCFRRPDCRERRSAERCEGSGIRDVCTEGWRRDP